MKGERGGWNPKLLVWVTCWRQKTAQTADSHPSPYNTLIRLTLHLNQFWLFLHQVWGQSWPWYGLVWWNKGWKGGLKSKVIGVSDLLETKDSSDSHPSPSDTLTRLTLHLNQFWLFLQVWGQIWPWWPGRNKKGGNHSPPTANYSGCG